MIKYLLYTACLCAFLVSSLEGYVRPFNFDPETWEMLSAYFLPEDHPIKEKLDKLFPDSTALDSIGKLKRAGFKHIKQRRSEMIVASHRKLKEYKVKLFLHSYPMPEWWFFKKRIEGAELIRAAIARHGFEHILKVPRKWIYPLPPAVLQKDPSTQKNFILIVEDMHIYAPNSNVTYFHTAILKEELKAIFTIINELQLIDSVYIDNIPRCLDQRFAFIDTEHYLVTDSPIPWQRLLAAIRSKRRPYLQALIEGKIED